MRVIAMALRAAFARDSSSPSSANEDLLDSEIAVDAHGQAVRLDVDIARRRGILQVQGAGLP
jgi:hypothetical protein